jgi:superoxide dismutase, Cu-Zn family
MKVSSTHAALLVAILTGCQPAVQVGTGTLATHATVRNAAGATLGVLSLESRPAGVKITGRLTSLPPGTHGIHLHQTGKCDPDAFTTAGAHLNPEGKRHGLENPAGPHAGDMPNIVANAAGEATVDLLSWPNVTVGSGAGGLFDADGSSIVVHAQADDQVTDPAGNSGARIACGVMER